MDTLLASFGPWFLFLLGSVVGLALGGIPLMLQNTRLRLRLEAQAAAQASQSQMQTQMGEQMRNLATQALQDNQQSFLTLASQTLQQQGQLNAKELEKRQEGIRALLTPLKESVDLYRQQTRTEQGALKQELASLSALGQDMSRQAAALRQALTAGPKGAGAWGEQQLKNVMTMAGMAEHVDFDLQAHLTGGQGQRLRPDAVVRLPGGGSIVVDAKAPIEALLHAHEAEGAQATAYLASYIQSLRGHISDLGAKAYWESLSATPEFVVLFLPNDSMLMTAFDQAPDLLEWATNKKVVLASPSTLIAMLTTVAHAWRQDSLQENAREIADLGKKLYAGLATLGGHFDRLHKGIEDTAKAYSGMVASLDTNVMPKARRFRDLQLDPGTKSLSEPKALEQSALRDPATLKNLDTGSDRQIVDQADPRQVGGGD